MSTFETEGLVDPVGQRIITRAFRRRRGTADVRRGLDAAVRSRLADRNVTAGERARVLRLGGSTAPADVL